MITLHGRACNGSCPAVTYSTFCYSILLWSPNCGIVSSNVIVPKCISNSPDVVISHRIGPQRQKFQLRPKEAQAHIEGGLPVRVGSRIENSVCRFIYYKRHTLTRIILTRLTQESIQAHHWRRPLCIEACCYKSLSWTIKSTRYL